MTSRRAGRNKIVTASRPVVVLEDQRLLIAPGATGAETALGYGAALCGSVAMIVLALHADLSVLQTAVLTLMGFDLCGGAVVNATRAAGRRFHCPEQRARRSLLFCAAHIHILVLAAIFPLFSMTTAVQFYIGLVASCAAARCAPPRLRSPIAYATATVLLMTWNIAPPLAGAVLPPYIAWVLPVMTIKLLLAHLVPRGDGAVRRE